MCVAILLSVQALLSSRVECAREDPTFVRLHPSLRSMRKRATCAVFDTFLRTLFIESCTSPTAPQPARSITGQAPRKVLCGLNRQTRGRPLLKIKILGPKRQDNVTTTSRIRRAVQGDSRLCWELMNSPDLSIRFSVRPCFPHSHRQTCMREGHAGLATGFGRYLSAMNATTEDGFIGARHNLILLTHNLRHGPAMRHTADQVNSSSLSRLW